MPMPSIRSIGSSTLPFDFDIFWPSASRIRPYIDMLERDLAGDVLGHHDHARHPEEDDVEAGDQHRRRQVEVERGFDLAGHSGVQSSVENGHSADDTRYRARPGRASARRRSRPCRPGAASSSLWATKTSPFAVPGRNLVAPPQLARDAPVLDVVQPLVVGVDPVFRHERISPGGDDHSSAFSVIDLPSAPGLATWRRTTGRSASAR